MGWDLDDIGEFVADVAGVPGDLVEAGASLFDGPGGVAGILVSGAALFVGGPLAVVPAFVAGVAVTAGLNAAIKIRTLWPEERTLASLVFGDTLPPYERILLTNLTGLNDRAFTIPNTHDECLVNLGHDFDDPIRSNKYPEFGQLLIHELAHAWQIHHHHFRPGLMCEGIVNQAEYALGGDVYNPGGGGRAWSDYNLEQQATILDLWYAGFVRGDDRKLYPVTANGLPIGGCSVRHPFYRYVVEVNDGAAPPAVGPLTVRTMARAKFGTERDFSVRSRFPRHGTGSLRQSLIGLRG